MVKLVLCKQTLTTAALSIDGAFRLLYGMVKFTHDSLQALLHNVLCKLYIFVVFFLFVLVLYDAVMLSTIRNKDLGL